MMKKIVGSPQPLFFEHKIQITKRNLNQIENILTSAASGQWPGWVRIMKKKRRSKISFNLFNRAFCAWTEEFRRLGRLSESQ